MNLLNGKASQKQQLIQKMKNTASIPYTMMTEDFLLLFTIPVLKLIQSRCIMNMEKIMN